MQLLFFVIRYASEAGVWVGCCKMMDESGRPGAEEEIWPFRTVEANNNFHK